MKLEEMNPQGSEKSKIEFQDIFAIHFDFVQYFHFFGGAVFGGIVSEDSGGLFHAGFDS